MKKILLREYKDKKNSIKKRIEDFRNLDPHRYYDEMIFCLLTPQSNAKKCWSAVQEIKKLNNFDAEKIANILKTRTRFHNNKTKYILESKKSWEKIINMLNNEDRIKLRNEISEIVKGYGLKEASHFLRNIGKSDNQIAILDRHILRNLKEFKVIKSDKIKNKIHYLDIERKFIAFSKKMKIPIDELDLLFWSRENGEIFK